MNILFVCKYNRFRSKVAEALFTHYNKKKGIIVRSAGLILDPISPYVTQLVIQILKKHRVKVLNEQSRIIDSRLIDWADKIIVVANNIPFEQFPPRKNPILAG